MPKRHARKKQKNGAGVAHQPPPPQGGTGPNPPWLERLFQIGMFAAGLGLVGMFIVLEMKGHTHGVGAWIGHAVNLGFATLFMFAAYRGLTRTCVFAKGLATAWRTKGGG